MTTRSDGRFALLTIQFCFSTTGDEDTSVPTLSQYTVLLNYISSRRVTVDIQRISCVDLESVVDKPMQLDKWTVLTVVDRLDTVSIYYTTMDTLFYFFSF